MVPSSSDATSDSITASVREPSSETSSVKGSSDESSESLISASTLWSSLEITTGPPVRNPSDGQRQKTL